MPQIYDVIIIGAGLGGLTAAAILARNRKKVLVLEKNHMPGGYAVNFKRGDFEFDASIHLINDLARAGGSAHSILEECGIKDKIELLASKHLYRVIYPDYDIRVPQCNPDEYAEVLSKHFPHEKDGIRKLFDVMSSIYYRVEGLRGSKLSTSDLFSCINRTAQEILDDYLESEELKAVVSVLWTYLGLPPSQLSAFYFCYPWHDYTFNGGYYPKGGGRSISNALVEVIKKHHGEVKLKSEVKRIIADNAVACGVENAQGTSYYGRHVISNIDINTTVHHLIVGSGISSEYVNQIDHMQPSVSAFSVYLGLNAHFRDTNIDDYIIFVYSNYDPDEQYASFLKNDIYNVPFSLSIYSSLPVDYAAGGKSVMTIMTLAGYDFWKNLDKDEYKAQKINFTNILIKRAGEIIPNLSAYIEKIEAATPLTMERYTGSCRGAIYGWNQTISQSGPRRLKQDTPIENLYLAGAWTQPGSGIKGVMRSGMKIANRILEEDS